MKVNLVVTAAGPNQGRSIPITGAKFLIGRDPGCHLRPASQAISKQHCAIHLRNGQVWVQDFGSTNGTHINDVPVIGEAQAKDGDNLKIGPLEFRLQVVPTPTPTDGTPLPDKLKPVAGKSSAAVKPVVAPAPVPTAAVPIKPTSGKDSDTADSLPSLPAAAGGDEDAAAMLLSMEDTPSGEAASVPEGSTVMDIPSPLAADGTPKKDEKGDDKAKKAQSREEMSGAANDLLRKYMRRPK